MDKARISIIGLGRVGRALLNVFVKKGYKVVSVYNRSEIDPDFVKKNPDTIFTKGIPKDTEELGDFIFLTVSDDAIESLANTLAESLDDLKGKSVIHCSGTYSSEILSSLSRIGATIASFHPMKAITPTTNSFEGVWFDMEGDEEVTVELDRIASELSANTFLVEPKAKPLLHASAVVASNYLVVLAELVSKISSLGDVPGETALKAITPLMENTLQNVKELGVTEALTGPIARGDLKTVKQHIESLKDAPELLSLYKTLGIEAVKIAIRKSGDSESLDEIRKLLS